MNITIAYPRQPDVTVALEQRNVHVAAMATRTITTNIGVVGPKGDKGEPGATGGLSPDTVVDGGYF